jgi:hypothetical protein
VSCWCVEIARQVYQVSAWDHLAQIPITDFSDDGARRDLHSLVMTTNCVLVLKYNSQACLLRRASHRLKTLKRMVQEVDYGETLSRIAHDWYDL